ncbi:MAG: hypothetical protein E2O39_08580 [Planctomycetota bacterium]|nr:MAG: hypothetical protein E2O39_08580 [Planctomycetota bacterium]
MMKSHVCSAAAVLMLAGTAYTRWSQAESAATTPTLEAARSEGVIAALNRVFRSPVAQEQDDEAQVLRELAEAVQEEAERDRELAERDRELAERDAELAERDAEKAGRQIEAVLRQLELSEAENTRLADEDIRRSLEHAERERGLAERQLEEALIQLEQAEDARALIAEEALLAREFEPALERRDAEARERDVRREYEAAMRAFKQAQQELEGRNLDRVHSRLRQDRKGFELLLDPAVELRAALELAQRQLAESKGEFSRSDRWVQALERLRSAPGSAEQRENAISAWRSARQGSRSAVVERLRSLDRRLAELGLEGSTPEHPGTCDHCEACRALHAKRGVHAAPEPTRQRVRGRAVRPREPRAPRAPREPREPRTPREPRYLLYSPGVQHDFSARTPCPPPAPAVPPHDAASGADGCCCCSTCPRCGASDAPKADAKPSAGGVSGLHFPTPTDFRFPTFMAPVITDFALGEFTFPAFSPRWVAPLASPDGADDPCEALEGTDAEYAPQLFGSDPFGEAWKLYSTTQPAGDSPQAYSLWVPGTRWVPGTSAGFVNFTARGGGDELDGHGAVLAEILALMEDMSIHLEELRGDVRGLREEVGAYRHGAPGVERGLPGAGGR